MKTFFELSDNDQIKALNYWELRLKNHMLHHTVTFEDARFNTVDTIEEGIIFCGEDFYTDFTQLIRTNAEVSLYTTGKEHVIDLDGLLPRFVGEKRV